MTSYNVNTFLNDHRLSFKAKGVLFYILAQPDGYRPSVDDLAQRSSDGANAVRAAIAELRLAGYAVVETQFSGNGQMRGQALRVACDPRYAQRPENQRFAAKHAAKSRKNSK